MNERMILFSWTVITDYGDILIMHLMLFFLRPVYSFRRHPFIYIVDTTVLFI